MKELHRLLLIFLVCLLAFSPAFFRAVPYGMDPYFYFNATCHKASLLNEPPLAKAIYYIMPCNFTAFNLLFFAACFSSALICSKLGTALNPERGWLAGIFVFATPLWLLEFWKFENDPLAYPFLFLAAYLFYKKGTNIRTKVASCALVGLAFFIWPGSLLWLIAFALTWLPLAIPVSTAILLRFADFYGQIAPKFNGAVESLPAFGLLYQGPLLAGLMYLKHVKVIIAPIAFFTLTAFINSKFAVHASFLLAISATIQSSKAESKAMRLLPFAGVFVVSLFLASMALFLPPDSQELEAVQLAVSEAGSSTVCNDWGTGHWVSFFGGSPLAKSGGEQLCQGCEDCVVLSYRDFNCTVLMGKEETDLKVYKC